MESIHNTYHKEIDQLNNTIISFHSESKSLVSNRKIVGPTCGGHGKTPFQNVSLQKVGSPIIPSIQQQQVLLKRAPITGLDIESIRKIFSSRIFYQHYAIDKLSLIASKLIEEEEEDEEEEEEDDEKIDDKSEKKECFGGINRRIYKGVLSGPSGIGKTEAVKVLREMVGVNEGYEHHGQYFFIDGSTNNNPTQSNSLTGPGAGYVGYNEKNLVDFLIDSSKSYGQKKIDSMDPKTKSYRDCLKTYNDILSKDSRSLTKEEKHLINHPPFIFIFFDQMHRACENLLVVLEGLLETGYIKSSSDKVFQLPKKMKLLVLFTSYFGADHITRMKCRDVKEAEIVVEEGMRSKGYGSSSIARFGQHIIFFAIEEQKMIEILSLRFKEYLKNKTEFSQIYGHIRYNENDVKTIVKRLVEGQGYKKTEKGVRSGLQNIFNQLDDLCYKSYYQLEQERKSRNNKEERISTGEVKLFMKIFDLESLEKEIQLPESIYFSIQEKNINIDIVSVYKTKAPNKGITTFGLERNSRPVYTSIIPFTQNNYFTTNINNYFFESNDSQSDNTRLVIQILKDKLKSQEKKLKYYKRIVNSSNNSKTNTKKSSPSSSSSSSSLSRENQKKRKRDSENENEPNKIRKEMKSCNRNNIKTHNTNTTNLTTTTTTTTNKKSLNKIGKNEKGGDFEYSDGQNNNNNNNNNIIIINKKNNKNNNNNDYQNNISNIDTPDMILCQSCKKLKNISKFTYKKKYKNESRLYTRKKCTSCKNK